MKRLIILTTFIVIGFASSAQTGLYKRYASRVGVQAYCVERYPLSGDDSVCVTLLQTDDSAVYGTLRRELHDLPYASRKKTAVDSGTNNNLPDGMTQKDIEASARKWREQNLVMIAAMMMAAGGN